MRDGVDWYDREGRPITLEDWGPLHSDHRYRNVAKTQVGDTRVSTVWLGFDHGWGDGPPLIFETMVFGGPLDQELLRCTTEAQAWEMHAVMVGRVRKAQHDQDSQREDVPDLRAQRLAHPPAGP